MTFIRKESRIITNNPMEIKSIIKEYYEQNLIIQMKWPNSLKDTFCQTHTRIDMLNRPISIKEIESVTKNLPKKKPAGQNGFSGKFYHLFKE